MKLILDRMRHISFTTVKIVSVLCAERVAVRTVAKQVKVWCREIAEQFGKQVFVRILFRGTTSKSIKDMLNNTTQTGRTPESSLG